MPSGSGDGRYQITDPTTCRIEKSTNEALGRIQEEIGEDKRQDTILFLVWYYDLTQEFGFSPEEAAVVAGQITYDRVITNPNSESLENDQNDL